MPSINSQIQLPVIPWVLWTVCDYKNTAEDKTAIHLKLYIFMSIPPLPIERMLIIDSPKHSWSYAQNKDCKHSSESIELSNDSLPSV